jgi:LPPG:FO 2-phospho-L-lactate transferase
VKRIVALSGGVGGAKLALGLSRVMPAGALTVVANTGDDFDHLGLRICPDIDTLMYVLAGLDDRERGWGRAGETWGFMDALKEMGGPAWFQLGDADLATHVLRTQRLARGQTLAEVTREFLQRLDVATHLLPMSNDPVRTQIRTGGNWIDFQDYFVRQRCEPVVQELRFQGAESAQPHPGVLAELLAPGLHAVVICPSNPFLSIAPILALSGMREALRASGAPVIAVSPIIGGQAVKGPTAKLMKEFGLPASATGVAAYYGDLIDIFVADQEDANASFPQAANTVFRQTWMKTMDDREVLARAVLALADEWRSARA